MFWKANHFAWLLALFLVAGCGDPLLAEQPAGASSGDVIAQAGQLIGQGKVNQALAMLNDFSQKAPGAPGLEALLGKCYYQKRDYDQAIAHFSAAIRQDPRDFESKQLLGLAYYTQGRLKQAIPLLEEVQAQLPHPDATGSYILGVSYLQTYQYDKARAAFARMLSVPPDSAGAHEALGQMLIREEFEEKAVPELQRALELNPRLPLAHFLLGEIYLFKSNVSLAVEEFQKEIAVNPLFYQAYWRLGDAYTRIEKWEEAEDALKKSIWLYQTDSGPYILLGKVEIKKGDAELATQFLEHALKMDPNNFSGHYLLGQAYRQLGRPQEAEREFDLSRRLHKDNNP